MKAAEHEGEQVLTPRQIYEALDRFVIGQEQAKRTVAVAAYSHARRIKARASGRRGRAGLLKKSNMLLIGPTGCGKTHIARQLAGILEVPFVVVDATEYTEAGYYGKDVEVMIAELLFKTGQDIEATERGIVFVDEVDKIARRTHGARTGAGSRDIGGEGVQQALLKLLEGSEVFVPLNVTQHWSKHDFVQVDTTDILFICAGTFSDLFAYGGDDDKAIGFEEKQRRQRGTTTEKGKGRIDEKALLEYGMLAEFLGRLPVRVELGRLSQRELERVIVEPPDSILREFRQRLALDEITLEVGKAAITAMAAHVMKQRTGARGLRAVFEDVLHDFLFEAPERRGETIVVDEVFVLERLNRAGK